MHKLRRTPNPVDEAGQTSTFLVKLVVTLAILGFLVIELGGPVITRIQVDNDAQDAMKDAAKVYDTSFYDVDAAKARLETELSGTGIVVTNVEVVENPEAKGTLDKQLLRATFQKDTHAYLFGKIPQLKDWYRVEMVIENEVR